nr:MAG TPA: endonuclease III [Caudoviricetes sp.]
MRDKINYANCMQRKCEQCKYYDYCFRYRRS